jgi:hypothetical protein
MHGDRDAATAMSGLLARQPPAERYQHAGAAEILPQQEQVTLPWAAPVGPPPWCRVCQRGAARWQWDRYADGLLGISASCHGEVCGGLLPPQVSPWDTRLEVFCADVPRLREFPLWFVGGRGEERQPVHAYLDAAVASGRVHPVLGGAFAGWLRRNAPVIVALLMPAGAGLPGLLKLVAWLLLLCQAIGQ